MAGIDPVGALAVVEGPALHIPDGFVSAPVAAAGWVAAAAVIAFAVRRADRNLEERAVPLMGVMAAFVFAAQMVNFPVAGGTSGHLIGAALAAILLGPWAAIIVMTAVVGLQALLFQDGGLAALGVNVLNMAVLSVLVATVVHRGAIKLGAALGASGVMLTVAVVAAAWLSVEAAAVATALELVVSNTSSADVALPALVGVHALIGIGEALITLGALGLIRAARPDLLARPAGAGTT